MATKHDGKTLLSHEPKKNEKRHGSKQKRWTALAGRWRCCWILLSRLLAAAAASTEH